MQLVRVNSTIFSDCNNPGPPYADDWFCHWADGSAFLKDYFSCPGNQFPGTASSAQYNQWVNNLPQGIARYSFTTQAIRYFHINLAMSHIPVYID